MLDEPAFPSTLHLFRSSVKCACFWQRNGQHISLQLSKRTSDSQTLQALKPHATAGTHGTGTGHNVLQQQGSGVAEPLDLKVAWEWLEGRVGLDSFSPRVEDTI